MGPFSGGVLKFARLSPTTVGLVINPPAQIQFLQVTNSGTFPVRIYDSQDAYDADFALAGTDGFIELGIAAGTNYFGGPATLRTLWFRGNGGTGAVNVAMYLR